MIVRVLLIALAAALPCGSQAVERHVGPSSSPFAGRSPADPAAATGIPCDETDSSIQVPPGYYYAAGAGVEVLDDLHVGLFPTGSLCSAEIGYFKTTAAPTTATVTFYRDTEGDTPPGTVIASMTVPGLSSGAQLLHVDFPTPDMPLDLWIGVSFSTDDAGLLLVNPPWPGASDDVFYQRSPDEFRTFGGDPRANFMVQVQANRSPTGVEPSGGERAGITGGPFPNPTTAGVELVFATPRPGHVKAEILDVAGRIIATPEDRDVTTGEHRIVWIDRTHRGRPAPPGVYLLRLAMPGYSGVRRIVRMQPMGAGVAGARSSRAPSTTRKRGSTLAPA